MKRATLLGFIGASLLIVGALFNFAELILIKIELYLDFSVMVPGVISAILEMIFPVSFAYVLYLINKKYK